eukprot:COSAG01_NODE_8105_length_2919_cov_4.539362_4_plen_53_part_00
MAAQTVMTEAPPDDCGCAAVLCVGSAPHTTPGKIVRYPRCCFWPSLSHDASH